MPVLKAARLVLLPGSPDVLRAELASHDALAAALGVDVPASWPPELYDADAVRWMLNALETARFTTDWGLYYLARRAESGERARLVGVSGFKGAPDSDGTVEIGYGVIVEERRRGYASEAVEALLEWAFSHSEVRRVIGHTLVDLTPSIRVLERTGLRYVGPGCDPTEPEAIQYALTRDEYERRHSPSASSNR